tara:strand:- start:2603 stop:3025 length:423 start_codon:yes stop_codon:yes gene_type:complete
MDPQIYDKKSKLIEKYMDNSCLNKIIINYDEKNNNFVNIGYLESNNDLCLYNIYEVNKLNNLYKKDNYQIFSEDVLEHHFKSFEDAEYIYINNAEKFKDLKKFILEMLEYNKKIIIFCNSNKETINELYKYNNNNIIRII